MSPKEAHPHAASVQNSKLIVLVSDAWQTSQKQDQIPWRFIYSLIPSSSRVFAYPPVTFHIFLKGRYMGWHSGINHAIIEVISAMRIFLLKRISSLLIYNLRNDDGVDLDNGNDRSYSIIYGELHKFFEPLLSRILIIQKLKQCSVKDTLYFALLLHFCI